MSRIAATAQRWLSVAGALERLKVGELVLGRLWRVATRYDGQRVRTRLHHHEAEMLFGNPYLRWMRRYPLYNAPLVEVVHRTAQSLERPVNVVDVGAAIGDTALLLTASCPHDVRHITCVEGDLAFLAMLRENVADLAAVSVVAELLTDRSGIGGALVHIHAGTASPQGPAVPGRPLDDVAALREVDVLKIDTDGFDGRVLAGAADTLATAQPHVIFEWHPLLLQATNGDVRQPFEVLLTARYSRCVWFAKDGSFSHVTSVAEALQNADRLAATCRALGAADVHYDVVALPDDSNVTEDQIAGLAYAREARDPG